MDKKNIEMINIKHKDTMKNIFRLILLFCLIQLHSERVDK